MTHTEAHHAAMLTRQALAKSDRDSDVARALGAHMPAEFYLRMGDEREAVKQADRALRKLLEGAK